MWIAATSGACGNKIATRSPRLMPCAPQCVGEPVGRLAQPAIGDLFVAPIRPSMQNGKAAGIVLRPAVADIDADIVAGGHRPAELADKQIVILDAR